MGNPTPVVIIADHKTTPEGSAIQQFERVASFDHIHAAAAMPDLHPGRGYPVGAAFFSESHLYPALIGGDIGCGMALWQTDLAARKHSADKLLRRIGDLESPLGDDWQVAITARLGMGDIPYRHALGTIGGGNHFAELQAVDTVYAPELLPEHFNAKCLQLLVHSGSRGLGQAVLRAHVDRFGHAGLPENTPEAAAYLAEHDNALAFARANRRLIAERMLARWSADGTCLLDVHHNFLQSVQIDNQTGWLHRKGATPSDCGMVVIPGSRGDYSYLVKPAADCTHSLNSLAHGAGRKWQRGECKGRLSHKYSADSLRRTAFGSVVVCEDKALIFEEAPQAYKSIDGVIAAMANAGLIEPVARLKPVLTYKTGGNCGDAA